MTLYKTVSLLPLFSLLLMADPASENFADIQTLIPDIRTDIRYAQSRNFVGKRIDGYDAQKCFLTLEAAASLKKVQKTLKPFGLGLKVFDCFRPQRAVDHFVRWAEDLNDTVTKTAYYPDVPKDNLFKAGYIAARSGHSRGSTLDVTLISLTDGNELDMGTPFDFFGPESWPASPAVNAQQRANRLLLQQVMTRHGFRPLAEEWWHFTLENEPYPEQYFNFPVR